MHHWEPHGSSGAAVIELDAVVALPTPRRTGARAVHLEWRPWLAFGAWMSSCLIVYVAAMIDIVYCQPAAIP